MEMKQKSFIKVVGLIFAVIATLHLARLVLGWSAVLGTFAVPTWASLVAAVVAGYLSYNAFRLSR